MSPVHFVTEFISIFWVPSCNNDGEVPALVTPDAVLPRQNNISKHTDNTKGRRNEATPVATKETAIALVPTLSAMATLDTAQHDFTNVKYKTTEVHTATLPIAQR